MKLKQEEGKKSQWKSEISKLDNHFGPLKRSSFDLAQISDRLWQAYLKRIADDGGVAMEIQLTFMLAMNNLMVLI